MSAPYFDSNEHPDDPAGDLCDRIIVQDGLGDRLSRIAAELDENASGVDLDAVTALIDTLEATLHEIESHVGDCVALPSHIAPLPVGMAARHAASFLGVNSPVWRHLCRLARA